MTLLQKPGFRFKEGRLLIFTENETMALHPWPELKARRKRTRKSEWEPFTPFFRLLRPKRRTTVISSQDTNGSMALGPKNVASLALDPELERRRAFDTFRFALPSEIAAAVERFQSRQWRLLKLAKAEPKVIDLLTQNPALGFCLANLDALISTVDGPIAQAARMALWKQREILNRLEFPDTDACAKIFAKILPEATHIPGVKRLKQALTDACALKLLAHTPRINAGILELVSDPRLRVSVSPKLLAEVASMDSENEHSGIAPILNDLQLMGEALNPNKPPKVFQSVAKMREVHQEVGIDYCKHQDSAHLKCRFPLPPLPGTKEIIPLLNPDELAEEGRNQQNCVRTYAKWVEVGTGYIYKVLRPERATLSITERPDGGWRIQQLLLARNQAVSVETQQAVEKWLQSYSLSV